MDSSGGSKIAKDGFNNEKDVFYEDKFSELGTTYVATADGTYGEKGFVTDVIKKYPQYPVFEGEKYVSLSYKYRLIGKDYFLGVINKPVCVVEYQENGSSMNMYRQYLNNPKGFAFIRKINMQYIDNKKRNFIDCIHYVSSSIISKNKSFVKESPKKLMTVLAVPFGLLLTVIIRIKAKKLMKVK